MMMNSELPKRVAEAINTVLWTQDSDPGSWQAAQAAIGVVYEWLGEQPLAAHAADAAIQRSADLKALSSCDRSTVNVGVCRLCSTGNHLSTQCACCGDGS